MSVYAKIQLVHHVLKYLQNYISTWTQNGGKSLAVSPALVETHVRFLTYAEVESLGVKGVLNQVISTCFSVYISPSEFYTETFRNSHSRFM